MEIARHVFDTYFQDTANPLVRHHLDSYADLLSTKIPQFIQGTNPRRLILGDDRIIDVYVGGKTGTSIRYAPPVDEMGNAQLPHACRLENKTYALQIFGEIVIDYILGKETETRTFENILIGRIPLMLKSSACYLSSMTSEQLYEAGECKFELGGYFVIGGAEKVLLTQEQLGDNMFYASKRVQIPLEAPKSKSLVQKETASKLEGSTKEDKYEFIAGLKSVSEDGTKGPFSHFLVIPPANAKPDDAKELSTATDLSVYSTNRLSVITLPGFTQPVPLISVFYALGLTSDQDIYDTALCGIPHSERSQYDEIFAELFLSHDKFVTQEMSKEDDKTIDPSLLFLRRQTQTRSTGGVYVNLYSQLFPHCKIRKDESASSFYRRKSYLLGHMLRMAIDVAIGVKPKTDRDHLRFKRLVASGDLCFQEFRRIYKDVSKRMIREMDSRVHYEQQIYAGKKIFELVQDENVAYYWRSYNFLNDIEKSFKGKWAGKDDGVSQELTRFGYVGTVAHLRRINVDMDKGTKIVDSRRIHASSWGMLCPSDNPDGRSVGLTKSMTLMCRISTASSSDAIVSLIEKYKSFINISRIHPSTWIPSWTKVFLNSDLIGIIENDTENIHYDLITKRRNQEIDKYVSLSWNRIENEYVISTDAGRPSRPIYREGVRAEDVKRSSGWEQIVNKYLDYVDASETESLKIQMEPFSPKYPSEIHGLAILSASASILPNSDFNPATRNAFSCQQMKQACSWYNTAFNKRFDTISTWLNYAQRPISQTWTTNAVLGKSGCLPYGENPIVALMVYSGYNQEDSILLNEGSLQRGMFSTTYYHSYDIAEDTIDAIQQTHTEFCNPVTNPKYRESVIRKEGYNYELLDGDGIIKPGSEIDDKTILVGIVNPISNQTHEVTGYRDSSYAPKRGQTGIVDAVYRYVTPEGWHGVKIRVAEKRIPVLGDKFSARHGQKGTVGMRVQEEDMPYTAAGVRPDMIVNPHAFPSRMTIGQFIEMMSTKLGIQMGSLMDATPFSTQNRVGELRDLLLKAGFHPNGHEVMYNGFTGEMFETEVFMAPTYYLRLKHMVEDKINYRATGPKKLLTHQPVEGRSNDGGLRIGEMERDGLISHGVSKFLNESLMERSDKVELLFQPETGKLDATADSQPVKLTTSYATGLTIHELEAMHISVTLASS
jgi:DNA-directed RNA polymerase II subunit RPB2